MKRRAFLALAAALGASLRAGESLAQAADTKFKPEELEQMLAPIALYPDALLSQIMMAASYPLEVVEAARWSKANPALKGDAAVNAVKDKEWDASVKSLVAFPDVLARMNDQLDWTRKLGDAMVAQEGDVADAIQRLRRRAAGAGNLQSTPQQTVTTEGSGESVQYAIAPANPGVVYVPSYDPNSAYGTWPNAAYPPTYWPTGGALASGILWGVGIAAAGAMFGGWAWRGYGSSYANVNVNKAVNIDRNFNRNQIGGDGRWQHRVDHRKGVAYRDNATRQRFNQQRPGAEQRQEFRGRLESGPQPRPGGGPGAAQRPALGADRPGAAQRPAGGADRPGNRAQQLPAQNLQNRTNQRPGALNGANRGQQINREGARGHQQINRSGGGGRPAGGGGRPGGGGGGGRPGGGGGGGRGGGGGGGGGGRPGGGGGGRGGGGGGGGRR